MTKSSSKQPKTKKVDVQTTVTPVLSPADRLAAITLQNTHLLNEELTMLVNYLAAATSKLEAAHSARPAIKLATAAAEICTLLVQNEQAVAGRVKNGLTVEAQSSSGGGETAS